MWSKAALIALLSVVITPTGSAQDVSVGDTARLREITVTTGRAATGLTTDGTAVRVLSGDLEGGMRAFGETDVTRALRMAPGISSVGDYGSGLSIDGAPASGTAYTSDGAQVMMPYHFGGIISAYHAAHYSSFTLDRGSAGVTAPMSMAGVLRAETSTAIPERSSGEVNVGMIGSGFALHLPASARTAIHAAARMSYIDLLYGHMLTFDDSRTHYILGDANLAVVHRPGDRDVLKVSAMWSGDRLRFDDLRSTMDTRLTWHNEAASARWSHTGESVDWMQTVSYTNYSGTLDLDISPMSILLPSAVRQIAGAGTIDMPAGWSAGYRAEYTRYVPQYAVIDGDEDGRQALHSVSVAAEAAWRSAKSWCTLSVRVRPWYWSSAGYRRVDLDPEVNVEVALPKGNLMVDVYRATQTMHALGYSELGSASDFRLPSTADLAPTRAWGADVRYTCQAVLPGLDVTIGALGRDVDNASEYYGNVLDVATKQYNPYDNVIVADGYDAGGWLSAEYSAGAVSARATYSYILSRRKYPMDPDRWLPSATEPQSSVKLAADWHTGRWQIAAAFVYADGRRYTPVAAIFMVAGNVLTEYGPRNSACLPAYHRLDLSATYTLPEIRIGGVRLTSMVNLSLANAYGRRNIEMQYYLYDADRNTIRLHSVPSLYRFLPSLSYTIKF